MEGMIDTGSAPAAHARASDTTLLCVGDLHLGKAPTRVPDDALVRAGLTRRDVSPAGAWERIVQAAVERQVSAVVLAGDVLDEKNKQFEALGPLDAGVRKLASHGIEVVAISGNHDVTALPPLADSIDGLVLLGRNGRWERHDINAGGGVPVSVVGWSFPERVVTTSPLAGAGTEEVRQLVAAAPAGAIVLGLLHCDLGQPASRYAPVAAAQLAVAPGAAWLLGHVHGTTIVPGPDRPVTTRTVGYLGGASPLDPGEPGWHGAWLATCTATGVALSRVNCARHRYEQVTLDISGLDSSRELLPALFAAIDVRHDAIIHELGDERIVICRLVLTGSHADRGGFVGELAAAGAVDEVRRERDGVTWACEPTIRDTTTLLLAPAATGDRRDLTAPLAALVVAGESIDPGLRRMVRRQLESELLGRGTFRQTGPAGSFELTDEALDALIRHAATMALEALDASRHPSTGAAAPA